MTSTVPLDLVPPADDQIDMLAEIPGLEARVKTPDQVSVKGDLHKDQGKLNLLLDTLVADPRYIECNYP